MDKVEVRHVNLWLLWIGMQRKDEIKEHDGTRGVFNTSDSFESFPAVIAVFFDVVLNNETLKKILKMLFKQNN